MLEFVKAMPHGAIFLATCHHAILLLRDVNLANTRLRYILLLYSSHIKQSSLVKCRIALQVAPCDRAFRNFLEVLSLVPFFGSKFSLRMCI